MSNVVVWFRRDLRVEDHPALRRAADEAAASGGVVIPLFVADDRLLAGAGANRRAYLADTLGTFNSDLDGFLGIRRGRPEDVVAGVAAEHGADLVVATGDCAPYGRERDRRVAAALGAEGKTLALVGSAYAVSPGRVMTGAGAPFRVFTPFRRAWASHGWPAPLDRPTGIRWRSPGEGAGDRGGLTVGASDLAPDSNEAAGELAAAGSEAAHGALEAFLDGPVNGYAEDRNRPDLDATSRLSPHLRFGTIHPRQVLAAVPEGRSAEVFCSEIAWREFYADVLWHRPDSAWNSLSPVGAHLRWDVGPEADEHFRAWTEGRTGYPLVDAGMRQLLAQGWMHNRVRMLVASFLVKDLHIDWRRGARHFMDHLIDGDVASNSHGWQWVAGTGTDAAPFYRIFSPERQAERFDPEGTFVARWVPEFGTPDYPAPIVDHGVERHEALARWEEAKVAAGASDDRPNAGQSTADPSES